MANWRKLPAGKDLDRIVAETLGFKAVELPEYTKQWTRNRSAYQPQITGNWYIVSPQHPDKPIHIWGKATAEEAWKLVFTDDFEFGGYDGEYLRRWSRSVDDALSLCQSVYANIKLLQSAVSRRWQAHLDDPGNPWGVQYEDDKPALAIVRAWLAYKGVE